MKPGRNKFPLNLIKKKTKKINKEQQTIEQIYQHALLVKRKIVDIQQEQKNR